MATVLSAFGAGSLAYFSDTETSSGNTFTAGVWGTIKVQIDIMPGGNPNPINLSSGGVIPVAILTTAVFDAANVDASTVLFGPGGAQAVSWALEDVDLDDDIDMTLKFNNDDTDFAVGDTQAELIGQTFGGINIHGSDSVNTVPPWDDE